MDLGFLDKPAERPVHPAMLDEDELLKDVTMERGRSGGPGGQHRNKNETAVTLTHGPTGISAQAGERRYAEINRKMVPLALDLLDISPDDTVLDLFCGLGNFTIPAAKRAGKVVGVEVSKAMVERGYENARRNGLENLEFHAWDLSQDVAGQSWANRKYDRILIDPPRTGALEMVKLMPRFGAKRIVYVSCNPATLARDAGELTALGYRLKAAGVMDMFPHTTHVESIAVFEKK